MCKRSYEAVFLGRRPQPFIVQFITLFHISSFPAFSRTARPAAVVRYLWLGLLGLSGMVRSKKPDARSASMYCLRKCFLFLILAADCNSSRVFSPASAALSIAKTWGVLGGCLGGTCPVHVRLVPTLHGTDLVPTWRPPAPALPD